MEYDGCASRKEKEDLLHLKYHLTGTDSLKWGLGRTATMQKFWSHEGIAQDQNPLRVHYRGVGAHYPQENPSRVRGNSI